MSTVQNFISLITEMNANDIPVVLSSQVPVGPADIVYKNAYDAVLAEAVAAVDLSLPESQVRLSCLCGHKKDIRAFAGKTKIDYLGVIEQLFMSGVKFRTKKSRRLYEKIRGFAVREDDFLLNCTFEESMKQFIETYRPDG